jgi:threonine dehydratase
LSLTDNLEGFDITSNGAFDPDIRFYDWMAYEILNENPEYVLVPYGTGQLYENVLNIAKHILTSPQPDPVYTGKKETISKCHFIGATSNNFNTLAVKLYAPFRPFAQSSPEWVRLFIQQGYCGNKSRIVEISEEFVKEGKRIMGELGIPAEYSGASAMGLLYQIRDQIPKDAKVLVVNTGNARF